MKAHRAINKQYSFFFTLKGCAGHYDPAQPLLLCETYTRTKKPQQRCSCRGFDYLLFGVALECSFGSFLVLVIGLSDKANNRNNYQTEQHRKCTCVNR